MTDARELLSRLRDAAHRLDMRSFALHNSPDVQVFRGWAKDCRAAADELERLLAIEEAIREWADAYDNLEYGAALWRELERLLAVSGEDG